MSKKSKPVLSCAAAKKTEQYAEDFSSEPTPGLEVALN